MLLQWDRFTTGNTHTAWVICRQVEQNAPRLGIDLKAAKVAVVGATGDIGSAVCRWMANKTGVAELLLVARQQQRLEDLREELGGGRILTLEQALPEADVVVWVAIRHALRDCCLSHQPNNKSSEAAAKSWVKYIK